jgi:nicotinamide-nucleotide amidase
MREMMLGTVLPDLRRRSGQASVIRSRVLRTWGMTESGLAEVLGPRIEELDKLGTPTLAFQASGMDGIKVRIVAKCDDEAAAQRILDAEEALIRKRLGADTIFGIDDQSMEAVVLELLRCKSLTLAAVETVTGGLLAERLSALDWGMQTFRGATVVPEGADLSAERRAATEAARARALFGADVGIAAMAATAQEGLAPGTVFCSVDLQGRASTGKVMLTPHRRRMREFSVISLLNQLRRMLSA